ncbi:protocadherin Fat 4-like [Ptychodera flava]|uniref:protocadherin Fat 4-like n=1 Tax=Ptychodera flava TaxID=63121 RepID=UPI00396A4B84
MFLPEDTLGSVYENEPPDTSVMTLSAYDPDSATNGPPFSYYLLDSDDSDSFNLDSVTGLLTTRVSLDREEQSDYFLPVESRDSGIPQMTSTTTMHISILDRNDNPSSPRTANIYVNCLNSIFPGGSIGIARPLDPDVDDVFTCEIISGDENIFSIRPGCDLHSTFHNGVESYDINVSGHDGIHDLVYSDFTVDYHTFSNNSLESSITVRLASETAGKRMDAQTFLTYHFTAFYDTVSDELNPADTLLIMDMYEVDDELDLLLAVRQPGDDKHMSRTGLASFFTSKQTVIESGANVVITKIDYSPCEEEPCMNNGECSDHVELYNNHISDSDPIIFVARQSSRVFNCTCRTPYFGQQCEQEPDSCESNPCENGATCHKESLSYYCECPPGFTGSLCETNIDECTSNPCVNGQCIDGINGYTCTCDGGYTGPRCDIEIDPCNPQPCFNEGECVAKNTGFKCDCGFGERGDFCEFSSFSFDVLSYVQYADISGSFNLVTLQFATTLDNSLLLYNHDGDHTVDHPEFIALEIVNGKARFSYDLGQGTVRISTDIIVSDGQWHKISARRERTKGTLVIDECQDRSSTYCFAEGQGVGNYTQLDLDGVPLNIGGVKSIESIALHPGQLSTTDFVGCMRDVYINGNFYDLKTPLDDYGVSSKCPRDVDKCASDPCQNGGTCIDEWWSYRCSCQDGFMGQHCESNMSSFTFGDDSFVKYVIKDSFRRNQLLQGNAKRRKRSSHNTQTASLMVRSRQNDGLLLYVADNDDYYTILEVKNGKAKYSFKLSGAGSGSITVDSVSISDGKWHTVELVKNGQEVTLSVDEMNSEEEDFDIPPHDFISITVQDMFLGGTEQPVTHEGRELTGLSGCIDTFKLNDEVMPFVGENDMVVAEPSDSSGDSGGCEGSDVCDPDPCPEGHFCKDKWEDFDCIPEGPCQSNPCQHNSTCVPESDGTGYVCQCYGDFFGDHCEIPPVCQDDPCSDNEECVSDGEGGHMCRIVDPNSGSGWMIPVVVVVVILLIAVVGIVVCFVLYRRKRAEKDHDKPTDSVVVNLDSVGAVNEAYTGDEVRKGESPTNSEKARLGRHGQQPDIIENEKKKIALDEDTMIIEGEDTMTNGIMFNEDIGDIPDAPEHYDLENASSIAPSDIDLTYHYKAYREGRNRYGKPTHKHRSKSPNHLLAHPAQTRQSPLSHLARQSPNPYAPTSRQSPYSMRQSPIPMHEQASRARFSPHHILNRTSPIKELSHSRTNSEQSINHSELRSEPGFRSNVSTASEHSRRTKSPAGPLPSSRPSSRLKSPITVAVDASAEQPMGLSAEEVAMLNNKRPEQVGSLPSTLDGLSSTSTDHPEERLTFRSAENLLEAPESSTDESNDSFTCSEYDFDREKNLNLTGKNLNLLNLIPGK